jgi:hypothetical protein
VLIVGVEKAPSARLEGISLTLAGYPQLIHAFLFKLFQRHSKTNVEGGDAMEYPFLTFLVGRGTSRQRKGLCQYGLLQWLSDMFLFIYNTEEGSAQRFGFEPNSSPG